MKELPVQPLRQDAHKLIKVTFEMSLDTIMFSRRRYNALDLLAQFGGFMGIFRWIFTTFIAAWNTNALENFMASKLYKVKVSTTRQQDQSRPSGPGGKDEESEWDLMRSRWPLLDEYLLSWVPLAHRCCKKRGSKARFAAARAQLSKEMNLVQMIKANRYYRKALDKLLNHELKVRIRAESEYTLLRVDQVSGATALEPARLEVQLGGRLETRNSEINANNRGVVR